MQKKNDLNTRTMVFMAVLAAMNIVLTRLLVIDLGFARITLGSVCTILGGLWFGPVAGALCGLVSDILGCFLKGYAVNPLITIAAMTWGVVPAAFRIMNKGSKTRLTVLISSGIVLASALSTLLFTTTGLVLLNGYDLYAILPSRLIQWAVMTPVYCVVTLAVYKSPLTGMVMGAAAGQRVS